MSAFIKGNGVKTSSKLEKIKDQAYDYMYGGRGYNSQKLESQYMRKLFKAFNNEAEKIGGVNYTLSDSLA